LQELLETTQHHFIHHAEESDEVRFARAVRSNEHGNRAKREIVQFFDGAKAFEA
jgi:hypothetical protein